MLRIVSSTNEFLFLQSMRDGHDTPGAVGTAIVPERRQSQDGSKALMADLETYLQLSNSYFPGQSGSAVDKTAAHVEKYEERDLPPLIGALGLALFGLE